MVRRDRVVRILHRDEIRRSAAPRVGRRLRPAAGARGVDRRRDLAVVREHLALRRVHRRVALRRLGRDAEVRLAPRPRRRRPRRAFGPRARTTATRPPARRARRAASSTASRRGRCRRGTAGELTTLIARSFPFTRLITSLPRYALPSVSVAPGEAGESVSGRRIRRRRREPRAARRRSVCVAPFPSTTAIGLSEETVRRLLPVGKEHADLPAVVCSRTVPG